MFDRLALALAPGAGVRRRVCAECPRWVVQAIDAFGNEDAAAEDVLERRGLPGLKAFFESLATLRSHGLLGYSIVSGTAAIVTWIPAAATVTVPGKPARRWCPTLSRFALVRRAGGAVLLESPVVRGRLLVRNAVALELIATLDGSRSVAKIIAATPLAEPVVRDLLELLRRDGFLDDADARLKGWEFHDLMFHARSRHGRHQDGYGAKARVTSPRPRPASPPASPREIVKLARPDLDRLRQDDLSLTAALEDRLSERRHDRSPITAPQLGEFLYRSARERRRSRGWKGIDHVAPSGGASYELDVYLAIRVCRGITPGLYRYDPKGHALWRRSGMTHLVRGLIAAAGFAARTKPQVVIIVSARFAKTMRRYSSMAYAMILKDVGVLFQTFYLVATAMDLAPCAIGGGDADDFARAAGTDYYQETSVGEFLLGRSSRKSVSPRGVPSPVHGSQPRPSAR